MTRLFTMTEERHEGLGGEITRHLDLKNGDSLVLVEGEDFVLVKRTASASRTQAFERLTAATQARFQDLKLQPHDVEEAIRWARESS